MSITLREYQFNVVERIREAFRAGHRSPLVVLPCGAGKSFIAAHIAESATSKGNRVLFCVHRQEILAQMIETFKLGGVDMDLCDMYMVQTATRRIDQIQPPSLIITDEAAHASAATYTNIYDAFPAALHVGFTASPVRLNGKPLGDVFDALIEGVSVTWLIENQRLSPYKYYAPQLADFSGVKKRAGDYAAEELEAILSKPKIFGDVIGHYRKIANGKKAISYSPSIKHSIDMCAEFNANGIPSAHLDGTTPPEERKAIMQAFRDGSIRVLCNNEIISEGVSVDDCEVVILLRKTASLALHIQQTGRSMRYLPGKTALIIDHVGNYIQHGLPDTERTWSLTDKIAPTKQYNVDGTLRIRQCNTCFFTFPTAPVCPNCGASYVITREEIQQIKEVELQEIKARKDAYKDKYKEDVELRVSRYVTDSECRNLSELQAFAKRTGRKSGWAWHMARVRGMVKA